MQHRASLRRCVIRPISLENSPERALLNRRAMRKALLFAVLALAIARPASTSAGSAGPPRAEGRRTACWVDRTVRLLTRSASTAVSIQMATPWGFRSVPRQRSADRTICGWSGSGCRLQPLWLDFGRHGSGVQGRGESCPGACTPGQRHVLTRPSTWLSLVKLRPRRDRLRFTRQSPV